MGWFDSLVSGAGDLFGGIADTVGNIGSDISGWFGGGSGVGDIAGGAADPLSVGVTPSILAQNGVSSVSDLLGSTALTPMDVMTNPNVISAISPAGTPGGIDTSGLVPTASTIGNLQSSFLGSGLFDPQTISRAIGDGSGAPQAARPAAGTAPSRQTQTPAGGSTTPAPAGGGGILGNLGGSVGGLLSNPAALMGLASPIMGAINAKDQTNLGPDAAKMRSIADSNQGLINSLSGEAQAEKVGNLPGPAMQALEASMAQQKAGLASRYAAMGMSGSSAEAADMAALNQQNESQRFQIGLNMANEGLNQVSGLQNQDVGIYQGLMDAQAQRDQEYMQAMADLASGLGKAFSGPSSTPAAPSSAAATTGAGLLDTATGFPVNEILGGGGGSTPTDVVSSIDSLISQGGGLTPSPAGGLVVPGLSDPNFGTSASDNINWSAAQPGSPQFLPSALSSYLQNGGDLTNLFATAA